MDDAGSPLENFKARSPLELRQIRYFVALAEELNFRKAAARLFITQPSLSHQIALLEGTLGVRLFHRDRRQVRLTEAGNALLEDARRLLTEAGRLHAKARQLEGQGSTTVRVGFPEFLNRTVIAEIVRIFRRRRPDARVVLHEGYSRALLEQLNQGTLDIAFIMIPSAERTDDLELEVMIDEKPGLLLSQRHHLAERSAIPVTALAGAEVLLAERSVNPAIYDLVAGWLEAAGVQPRFFSVAGPGVYTYDTALRLMECGEAVSLAPASMATNLPPGVIWRPIAGPAPHFRVAAAWSPANRSALLEEFLAVAREVREEAPVEAIS